MKTVAEHRADALARALAAFPGPQADLVRAVVNDWLERVDEEEQMDLLRAVLPPKPEEEGEEAYERLTAAWEAAYESLNDLAVFGEKAE